MKDFNMFEVLNSRRFTAEDQLLAHFDLFYKSQVTQPSYPCQHTECSNLDPVPQQVFRCVDCRANYCDNCWKKVEPHKKPELEHKKVDPGLADLLKNILEPAREQRDDLHKEDARTLWVGVTEKDDKKFIHEGSVYEDLIFENPAIQPWGIYPGLVTFVGDTGKMNPQTILYLYSNKQCLQVPGKVRSSSSSSTWGYGKNTVFPLSLTGRAHSRFKRVQRINDQPLSLVAKTMNKLLRRLMFTYTRIPGHFPLKVKITVLCCMQTVKDLGEESKTRWRLELVSRTSTLWANRSSSTRKYSHS